MRDREFSKNKFCLWHAKYGGMVEYPSGREMAQQIETPIDCTVACLGAGSILEGIQIPVQDVFEEKGLPSPAIFIAEHDLSPLFTKSIGILTNSTRCHAVAHGGCEKVSSRTGAFPHRHWPSLRRDQSATLSDIYSKSKGSCSVFGS